jgi:hypothetical protein
MYAYVEDVPGTSITTLRTTTWANAIQNMETDKPHLQHKLKTAGGIQADGQGMFPNHVLRMLGMTPTTVSRLHVLLMPSRANDEVTEYSIQLYKLVTPRDPTCLAKVGHSWVSYLIERHPDGLTNTESTVTQRLGRLIAIVGNAKMSTGSFAVINAYNMTQETDLGHNPVIVDAHHTDVVMTEQILQVNNVQHHCTNNCHPMLTGHLRRDLRQFKVPEAIVCHDIHETRFVLNKHRLK